MYLDTKNISVSVYYIPKSSNPFLESNRKICMPLITVKVLNRFGPISAGFALLFLFRFLCLLLAIALHPRPLTLGSKKTVNDRNDRLTVAGGIVGVNVARSHRSVAQHFRKRLRSFLWGMKPWMLVYHFWWRNRELLIRAFTQEKRLVQWLCSK